MVRSDQGNESPNTSYSITFMIEPKHRPAKTGGFEMGEDHPPNAN